MDAIQSFTAAIKYYPYQAEFFVDRATCYVITGQLKRAETDYYQAHQLDPNNVEALNYVGKFDESSFKPYRNVIVLNHDDWWERVYVSVSLNTVAVIHNETLNVQCIL